MLSLYTPVLLITDLLAKVRNDISRRREVDVAICFIIIAGIIAFSQFAVRLEELLTFRFLAG